MKSLLCFLFLIQSSFALEGLKVGAKAPILEMKSTQGEVIDLSSSTPTVLVFYRGAWCPYCMKQLKELSSDLSPKVKGKARLVAISVDPKKVAAKMKERYGLSFDIVSDPKGKILKDFNIVNEVSMDLSKKYKSTYEFEIKDNKGQIQTMIAHPAVFIVKAGKITFADIHKNYKERTDNQLILKSLKL